MERRDDVRLRAGRLLVGSMSSLLNISNLCKFSLESLSLEGRSSWGSSERCTPSGSSALATKSSCKLSSESSCLEGEVLRGRFGGRTTSRCSGLAVESRERFRSLLVERGWGGGRRGSSKQRTSSGSLALIIESSCKFLVNLCLEGGVLRAYFEGRTPSSSLALASRSCKRFRLVQPGRGVGEVRAGDGWISGAWGAFRGPVSHCRLMFSGVAESARRAMGMEREKRNA